jgi:hypothetical protein
MSALDLADLAALRLLAVTYARGVDRRDRGLYLSAFSPSARLEVSPTVTMDGHDQIGLVVELIARYDRTLHLLGQSAYEAAPAAPAGSEGPEGEATGEVYCVAHHFSADGHDYVMYIRYDDRYTRCDGRWLIAARRVLVDATQNIPAKVTDEENHAGRS